VKTQHQKILGMSAYWALVSPDIEFSSVTLGFDRERKDDVRNVGLLAVSTTGHRMPPTRWG
jgi:hypothetical protein